jgi:hypothetical protein
LHSGNLPPNSCLSTTYGLELDSNWQHPNFGWAFVFISASILSNAA